MQSTDKDRKASAYNVGLEWEDGERTYEPLTMITADDSVTCANKTFDLVYTLRYLGVRVRPHVHLLGDNESVVNNASIPQSRLHKRHMALSYHHVREAIASGFIQFHFIPGVAKSDDKPP